MAPWPGLSHLRGDTYPSPPAWARAGHQGRMAIGGRERPYGGRFQGTQPHLRPCKPSGLTCCCCIVHPCLHLSRPATPFQVWGHCKEQRAGDGGRKAVLEHLASVAVLGGHQEENQERPAADHPHHQQDRSEKAGVLRGATAGQDSPRKGGQDPKERQTLATRNVKASRVGGPEDGAFPKSQLGKPHPFLPSSPREH